MGKASTPQAPNYSAAASAQADASNTAAAGQSAINRPNVFTPDGAQIWSLRPGADVSNPQIGDWNVETDLSPVQQQLYDIQNANKVSLGNIATQGISSIDNKLGQPFDTSSLPAMAQFDPNAGTIAGQAGTDASDALYRAATSRLDPRFQAEDTALRTRLANQGIFAGSAAYDTEMAGEGRTRNDAYQQAMDSSIAGGAGAEAQKYQNLLTAMNATNSGRQQGIQEQAYLRSLPLNEFNALTSGSQVSMPQFQPFYTGAQTSAAPVYQAAQNQYGASVDAANLQNSQRNALIGGLASVGGAALAS